jgi:adenylate kinase
MIVLTGVAGAGKSMQGRLLSDELGFAWVSTGEILRVLITGKRRQEMLRGKLLHDYEVIEILDKIFELVDVKQQFILDGFPRTIPQADWLLQQSEKGRFGLDCVVHLAANEDVVRKRLLSRGRTDDTDEAIAERFKEYREVTKPILEHFEEEGVPIYNVDAGMTPKEVHDQIVSYLDGLISEQSLAKA